MTQNYDKIARAIDKALEEQIIPLLFTPAQLAEMDKPHYGRHHLYYAANLMTIEKEYKVLDTVKPQLAITDPRITKAQIAALPKTLDVTVDGKTHTVPLRVFEMHHHASVKEWREAVDFQAESHRGAEGLEKSLARKFNLVAGKDFSIGYGIGADKKGNKVASYMVQMFDNAALKKQGKAVQDFAEKEIAVITPGRPSSVMVHGPIILH